ncbi:MAG: glycosyltransferase family 2 protein [Thermoplasmatota archaeon]
MTSPFLSVIVPVYNDVARLRLLLEALRVQTYPAGRFEVLVVDNASTEDVQGTVRAAGPPFVALHEGRPGSYAARNRALAQAQGEVLAFTDGDCIPAPDWLERGVAALEADPSAGLVAGRIEVFPRGRRRTLVERYEMVYAFPQERFAREQHFGATANVFTRRAVMDRVGPFNAALKSGGDREWGQRVHAAGLPVVYAADVVVRHPARRTFREYEGKVRRIVGGMRDLDRDRSVMTVRLIPGHLVHITRKVVRRIPAHRAAAGESGGALRLAAVEWWFEYIRMRERLRLRKGSVSRR